MSILSRIRDYFSFEPEKGVLFCINCKYIMLNTHEDREYAIRFAKCKRTCKVSLVGCKESLEDMNFCSLEREWKDHCGPSARYFERKQ